jgi:hypothetical protein
MANGDGSGAVPVRVDPPPPPRAMRILSFAFGIAAGIAGLTGYCELAGILALVSVGFNLADYFMNRGTVEIPRSALDAEGRVKGFNRPGSPSSGT